MGSHVSSHLPPPATTVLPVTPEAQLAEAFLLAYFLLSFTAILLLGMNQRTNDDIYSRLGIILLITQGVIVIGSLATNPLFPAGASWLAFTLIIHHSLIHRNSTFEGETCSCAPFQCKDILNHETWIMGCLIACVVSFFRF